MLPLELSDPDQYGDFDSGQLELFKHNAYDLVLIENATELFRQVMHDQPGNLEAMLKLVVEAAGSDCVYLTSETFLYHISDKTQENFPEVPVKKDNDANKKPYYSTLARYKRKHLNAAVKQNKCIVGLFAVDLASGGHYAAYVWNNKKLLIFDSMSTSKDTSAYYPFFQQLGRDLFGVPKELAIPCIKGLLSLQYTGGFPQHPPGATEDILRPQIEAAEDKGDEKEFERLTALLDSITLQSMDSQNHFCYMWSIWFIHALLAGYSLEELTTAIHKSGGDPLFVIKRYAWTMLQLAGLEKELEHADLYEKYFPMVWYNPGGAASDDFIPVQLEMYSCNDANECLEKSFGSLELTTVPRTKVPEQVMDKVFD